MKLLILSDASSSHTIKWANSLCQAGIEVHLFTLSDFTGFTVEEMETEDVWAKSNPATIQLLQQLQFSADLRGDNIFVLARKTSPPIDRYPESLYVVQSDSHGPEAVSVQDNDA